MDITEYWVHWFQLVGSPIFIFVFSNFIKNYAKEVKLTKKLNTYTVYIERGE